MREPCGIQVATKPAKIAPHRREYLLAADSDLTLSGVRPTERIFEMQLNRTFERSSCKHRAEGRKANHAFSERNPVWFPALASVSLPEKILEGDTANVSVGNPEAIDPTAQTAFNGGVSDDHN